jgi:outer membrane protein assembly factor BamB
MNTPLFDPKLKASQFIRQSRNGPLLNCLLMAPLLAVASHAAPASVDQNWPQWRGPLANGVALSANPPVSWSETSNIKWKVKIPGSGTGTPVIWQNQIFVLTAVPGEKKRETSGKAAVPPAGTVVGLPQAQSPQEDRPRRRPGGPGAGGGRSEKPADPFQFTLLSLDRQSGKTLWQKVAREEVPHEGHHRDHGYASHSPITDGQSVFAYFGSRGLYSYDLQGKLKWKKEFGRMQTRNGFGEGSSPALSGNTLVINWDHEGEDFIVALDKETGKELWRQPRNEETTWVTPLIVQHGGETQVILPATRKVRSYDLATGKLIWECGGLGSNVIPMPVVGHGMVFVMSGHNNKKLLAIRLGRTGDLTGTDAVAWSIDKSTPYVPSPLLYGDHLYFFSGRDGRLSCFDAKSGRPHYEAVSLEGLPGVYASPVYADGRLYLVGRNGAAMVIKHSEKLEVLATNRLEEKFDASPALAGGELFLRGHEYLYCIAGK